MRRVPCFYGRQWCEFQSTHSLRSATADCGAHQEAVPVSIHALLAECDVNLNVVCIMNKSFNPRTPCGVRHVEEAIHIGETSFNPRTPCGVRPHSMMTFPGLAVFQSTHSLRSATRIKSVRFDYTAGFNPRTPCGVRRNRLYTLLLNRANHTLRQPP